ncbi:MAG: alpha-L-rhamnosidase C-terminal domain-containing protein [Paludibacter sp.]
MPSILIQLNADNLVQNYKSTSTQVEYPEYQQKNWQAFWVSVPNINPRGYGVYYFRKSIDLANPPTSSCPMFVSADNRYKLFVNEKLVSLGPARSDIQHWNYETVDLTPYLHKGKNIIAAQVWNEGNLRPEGHISLRTAFILQGATDIAQVLNTNETWKCIQDSSYAPIPFITPTYFVAGPGELIKIAKQPKGWKSITFQDDSWKAAQTISSGQPKNILGGYGIVNNWALMESKLPQMEQTYQRLLVLRKSEGLDINVSFPAKKTPITIPSNTVVKLLLDQSFLTNAYPTLIFNGGKDSRISIRYQETLFSKFPQKGNRNDIINKVMIGRVDSIISDGSENQSFTTLNWRTFRYIQLNIETKNDPLVLEDIYSTFTGYPFQNQSKLETDNSELNKMFEIGNRTARLCAMETYMDCPYYEQLQYIGDTRIQALISLYNFGDDRLIRNALNQMSYSQLTEGVTASRHPSVTPQYISTFSLWYIAMLHDYLMYGGDISFVKEKLPSVRQVLNFFKSFQEKDGSLKNLPFWTFTDWVTSNGWHEGIGPIGKNGNSALLDLQLLWAYQLASDLENKLGYKEISLEYLQNAELLRKTISVKYWDDNRKLFADRPERDLFSQHTNTLAILTGAVSTNEAKRIAMKLQSDTTLAPASIYFKYYLHLALTKAGLGNDYMKWLDKWRQNMSMGLTTWAETSDLNTTRSDCHAWGSSPNIEFFRILLGVDSDAPGFSKVKIEPHLGDLRVIGGRIPHPNGMIIVNYKVTDRKFIADIDLPKNTTGRFLYNGKDYKLNEGKNILNIDFKQ